MEIDLDGARGNSPRKGMKLPAIALAILAIGAPTTGACQTTRQTPDASPATPASVRNVLAAHRFTLEVPYRNTWSAERKMVNAGLLVVVEVDPAYVVPRELPEPVLYAGDVPVQRLNQGDQSGRVIAIVPDSIDIATAPIWFGLPALPERISAALARKERARAEQAGVRPAGAARARAVQRADVSTRDLATLLRTTASELVLEFSPQEKRLADQWRLPVAKAPTKKGN